MIPRPSCLQGIGGDPGAGRCGPEASERASRELLGGATSAATAAVAYPRDLCDAGQSPPGVHD